MAEICITILLLAASWSLAHLYAWAQTRYGLMVGLTLVAAGALGSVVMGIFYHFTLWRTLGPRSKLPPGWYWSPSSYHGSLTADERLRVLPWFYAGALGFIMVVIGAATVLMAVRGAHGGLNGDG